MKYAAGAIICAIILFTQACKKDKSEERIVPCVEFTVTSTFREYAGSRIPDSVDVNYTNDTVVIGKVYGGSIIRKNITASDMARIEDSLRNTSGGNGMKKYKYGIDSKSLIHQYYEKTDGAFGSQVCQE